MSSTVQKIANIYIISTITLFLYTFNEVYRKSSNYFSACLIYIDDTITNFIFYNMIFCVGVLAYKFTIWLFFVEVKENQSIKLVDKLKARIWDVLLLIYLLNGEIEMDSFACIIFMFFSYLIHCMAIFRSQFLIHSPVNLSLSLNYRLMGLMLVLIFFDYEILSYSFQLLYSESVSHFVFVYYTITISLSLVEPAVRYFIDFYQKYTLCHIRNIDEKLATISLWITIPRLFVQILFTVWLIMRFNLFYFFLLNIIDLVSQLTSTIKSYNRVKKLTDTMKNLKKIDLEEIKKHHDNTCMVCFQDMTEATLLPCKHFFHDQCLRQWIIKNSNHFCPKCKKQFNFEAKIDDKKQEKQNNENQQGLVNQTDVIKKLRQQRLKRLDKMQDKMIKQKLKRKKKDANSKQSLSQEAQNLAQKNKKSKQLINEQEYLAEEFPQVKPKTQQKDSEESQLKQLKLKKKSSSKSIPLEVFSLDTPWEIVRQHRQEYLKLGSLAFNLPTEAVYQRSYKHMFIRDTYERVNEDLIKYFSLREYQKMMFFADS